MSMSDAVFSTLTNNPLFHGFTAQEIKRLSALGQETKFASDEFILKEGDVSDKIYLIKEGSVDVLKKDTTETVDHLIATLQAGDVIGEVGLVLMKKRDASIRASTPTVLIAFAIPDLRRDENEDIYTKLCRNLSSVLANRLEYTYNVTVEAMRVTVRQHKRMVLYQLVLLVAMGFLLFQLGMSFYYIYHSNEFCKLKYDTSQPSVTVNRGIGL